MLKYLCSSEVFKIFDEPHKLLGNNEKQLFEKKKIYICRSWNENLHQDRCIEMVIEFIMFPYVQVALNSNVYDLAQGKDI